MPYSEVPFSSVFVYECDGNTNDKQKNGKIRSVGVRPFHRVLNGS
jgi:hypothetical protein